ncbi:hypothetical protein D3C78_1030890 [compost metagenome]
MYIMRHLFLITADIHGSALLQPRIQLLAFLQHSMLYVDLLIGIPRKGYIHAGQHSILKPFLPFQLIEEIGRKMLISIKQPGLAASTGFFTLSKKCSEWSHACARSNHNNWRIRIVRKLKVIIMLDIDRQLLA